MLEEAVTALVESPNADGGWGAHAGGPSRTEATALAVLGLGSSGAAGAESAVDGGVAWLVRRQNADGSWPVSDAVPGASWMSGLATLALTRVAHEDRRAERGARWLLGQEGRGLPWLLRVIKAFTPGGGRSWGEVELDPQLKGWPWLPDTFSWIEPTAYALIAIKALRDRLPDGGAGRRIREGEAMIRDRACAGGGWNYGNPRVFGQDLWPYPDTTSWALIALQDAPDETTEAAEPALRRMLGETPSLLTLSLGAVCLRAYRRDVSDLLAELTARWPGAAVRRETRVTALTVLAFAAAQPFRLTDRA